MMLYTAENEFLKISVHTNGAQLQSIYSKAADTEYLWQGEQKYWTGRAYNLFPVIGRMFGEYYTYRGEKYSLKCHGIARYREFKLFEQTDTKLVFLLEEDEETLKNYPFRFRFYVAYELNGYTLNVTYTVENPDDKPLIFAVGGHPGFNIPFSKGKFEEHYIEFEKRTPVVKHTLSENKLMSGKTEEFLLEGGVRLHLKHELFDDDAVILENTSGSVYVKSNITPERYIKMNYSDFKYLGLWQTAAKDTPFLCLEPWSALPATDGIHDDLETKADMTHLAPSEKQDFRFSLEFHE